MTSFFLQNKKDVPNKNNNDIHCYPKKKHFFFFLTVYFINYFIKLNFSKYIKSNHFLLSHHHSTSALVSEILMSVLQTVQKNNRQFTYGQTVQKKKKNADNLHMDSAKKQQQTIYIWTDSAKKTTDNLHMDRQCKKTKNKQKTCTGAFTVLQTVQKNTTTAIYIWTDSAKKQQQFTYGQTVQKNNSNLHMDRQCKKATAIYIWTDSAKKQQTVYIWTDSAKKQQQFTYGQTVQKSNSNLHMDRQCKKNNRQFTYGQTVQKKQQQFTYGQTVQKSNSNLHMYRQCKKTTDSLHMDRQCKKTTDNLPMDRQCKKTTDNLPMDRQCKKTTAIYIWTVHIYRLYRRQCAKYTYIYSVHIVYYKDILNYQRHIIHRMGTSALCTVSIHNVVYA